MPFGAGKRAERFDFIIRPHVKELYQAAYRLTRNSADAEDLVQDVLVKAYTQLKVMEQIEALRPWLHRVLYHQFIDGTRKKSRSPDTVNDELLLTSIPDNGPDPERQAAQADTARDLNRAISGLSADQRALIDLHIIQGYTLKELVEVFDAPLGTLKARVHRIKANLKKDLQNATFSLN